MPQSGTLTMRRHEAVAVITGSMHFDVDLCPEAGAEAHCCSFPAILLQMSAQFTGAKANLG